MLRTGCRFLGGRAAAAPLDPQDFAYGLSLRASDAPIQTYALPLEVYRGVTRADLGDLRVFNEAREEVPHAVRALVVRPPQAAKTVALRFRSIMCHNIEDDMNPRFWTCDELKS